MTLIWFGSRPSKLQIQLIIFRPTIQNINFRADTVLPALLISVRVLSKFYRCSIIKRYILGRSKTFSLSYLLLGPFTTILSIKTLTIYRIYVQRMTVTILINYVTEFIAPYNKVVYRRRPKGVIIIVISYKDSASST